MSKKLLFFSKESFFYILGNGTLHFSVQARKEIEKTTLKKFLIFSQNKAFLIFQETEAPTKKYIFQETELSYILGKLYSEP